MAFRKPASKKVGLKVLLVGKPGSGKTTTALSFPGIAALDSENGMTFYEDKEEGRNLVLVDNTQNFYDLEEAIEEIQDIYEEENVQTLLIDSETKFYANVQETIMNVEEKRAARKGRDVLDTNLSVRSWGKIKQITEKLQNMKIDLTSKGVNLVSVAQIKDKKEKIGDEFVVTGFDIVMNKGADYDYDIILQQFSKTEDGETKYFARVMKDRTKTFKEGNVVENPRYELWSSEVDKRKDKETVSSSYSKEDAKDRYEAEVEEEETPLEERMSAILAKFKEEKDSRLAEIAERFKAAKISPSMKGLTAKQKESLELIYQDYK